MKALALFLTLACLSNFAFAQVKVTDFNQPELKGHVKQVIEYGYKGNNNGINVDTTLRGEKTIKNYDEKGNEINEYDFDVTGAPAFEFLFSYSGDTLVIKKQYSSANILIEEYYYRFNRDGVETEFDTFLHRNLFEGQGTKTYYTYDVKGNRIIETQYNLKGQLLITDSTFYDRSGRIIEKHLHSGGNKYYSQSVFRNNGDKNGFQKLDYDKNGKSTGGLTQIVSKFDSHGNWLLRISENSNHTRQGNYVYRTILKRIITYY